MYKLRNTTAIVPRTAMPAAIPHRPANSFYKSNLLATNNNDDMGKGGSATKYTKSKHERKSTQELASAFNSDMPLPLFSKKQRGSSGGGGSSRTSGSSIPSTPSTPGSMPQLEEQVSCLSKAWASFRLDASGAPDESIVVYRPRFSGPPPGSDFVAFNVEKFMAERILKAADIDPRIVHLF